MPRPDEVAPGPNGPSGYPIPFGPLPLALAGLTLLAVEDSRFASDALRLMCQRSGARLRRADTLAAAAAHLRVYRPDLVIVDLGLPDGCGTDLIRSLARGGMPVLATSGAADGGGAALAAGAAGFLEKPLGGLGAFQAAVLAALPDRATPALASAAHVRPDPMALADDLGLAARLVAAGPDAGQRQWLAGFLGSLARQAGDPGLAAAVSGIATPGADLSRLAGVLQARLSGTALIG